jgi:hypothetical protein
MEEILTIPEYPEKMFRREFQRADRAVINRLKEEGIHICRERFQKEDIIHMLNKFKKGYVYIQKGEYKGFVLWKEGVSAPTFLRASSNETPRRFMEVLLICTHKDTIRLGSQILKELDEYCITNGIHEIILHPANPGVVLFYAKYGYKIVSTGAGTVPVLMAKEPSLLRVVRSSPKTRKRGRTTIPKRGTIEFYNTLLHPLLHNSVAYERLNLGLNINQSEEEEP